MKPAHLLGSLSGVTKVSNIGRRSNIPTPTLFGVVLKVPIKSVFTLGLSPCVLLTQTSATNFTLYIFATMPEFDTENIICCPIGSVLYKGFWSIDTAAILFYFFFVGNEPNISSFNALKKSEPKVCIPKPNGC